MVLNGSDYVVFIDTVTPVTGLPGALNLYRPVVCGKSNGFNGEVESISVRNKCDGGWENSMAGYGTWGISMDGMAFSLRNSEKVLKANFEEISQLFVNKTHFWAMVSDVNNTVIRRGVVRISSYSETLNLDEPYSFNISLVGIGKPILVTNIPAIPELGGVYFGGSGSLPNTQAKVKALTLQAPTILNWTFDTGLNRFFTVAFQTGLTLVSVIDTTNTLPENVTSEFNLINVTVDGFNYNVWVMENDIAFSTNHTFNVTLANG